MVITVPDIGPVDALTTVKYNKVDCGASPFAPTMFWQYQIYGTVSNITLRMIFCVASAGTGASDERVESVVWAAALPYNRTSHALLDATDKI